ncbi:predicted protein [Nematostella vectensis]|uniref:Uncharacterized protein n=1 Tax=Nematostella vectensis TaxID=45351 RepID=A7SJ27_NEMVE|nr:uncharacterized protein LOC5507701 [Nematostella vectensis]EDO36264.1 predicted protein [Nematostella vectensis]|eukprot:XP_001628327.1 predicted protein [Nematostella vectensis]
MVILLFCLAFASIAFSTGRAQSAKPLVCNGMAELCDLRLDQVTLPGTHNSGSGFNGHLYHWGGGLAGSHFFRNQQWNFTHQLDYGIRYFDIDTCYVGKGNGDWWKEGAWTCHMGPAGAAFAGPVRQLLNQIRNWMEKPEHRNEVIVIKFGRDVEESKNRKNIYEDILKTLKDFNWKPTQATLHKKSLTTNAEFGKNYKWPTLRSAIESNQRVFVFMSEKLLEHEDPAEFHNNRWIVVAEAQVKITWPEILVWGKDCSEVVPNTEKNCEKFKNSGLLELDVFGSSMLFSTWEMQSSCDTYMQEAMDKCFAKRKPFHRTVNAVIADWVNRSKAPNSVLAVAHKQNLKNIAMFRNNGRK